MKWPVLPVLGSVVLNKLMLELRYSLLALGFFTRLPVPRWDGYQDSDLNHAAKYFPLVGVLVGGLGALAYVLSQPYLPHSIAVLISMTVTIYITGAFHEDGLADSADGLGGGWTREQILNIMVDSRLGTYGAVALFLVLFAKFQLLSALLPSWLPWALVIGHALSRLLGVCLMTTMHYAKPDGKAKPLATELSLLAICVASIFGLLPVVLAGILLSSTLTIQALVQLSLFAILPMLLSWLWWRHQLQRKIGGYTGDTLGAVQQLTELAFYFGLVLWSMNQ